MIPVPKKPVRKKAPQRSPNAMQTTISLSVQAKLAADELRARENRNFSNFIETLIREAARKHGIKEFHKE